jgi:hypothetical protein
VLTLGLCLASAAFALWAVQTTALDEGSLHRNAREVLAESTVRGAMTNRLAGALAATAPAATADPTAFAALSERVLDQPAFVAAFAGALDRIQARVTRGASGAITLDPVLVNEAVRSATADQPTVLAELTAGPPLAIQVPEEQAPDLAQWADLWRAATRAFACFGLALITYGLLRIDRRLWAIGKVGRWAIGVGVATLALFWLAPRALLEPIGGWVAVGGAVARGGAPLITAALAMIMAGVLAVVAAHRWQANDRARVLSVIPHAPSRSAAGSHPWQSPV